MLPIPLTRHVCIQSAHLPLYHLNPHTCALETGSCIGIPYHEVPEMHFTMLPGFRSLSLPCSHNKFSNQTTSFRRYINLNLRRRLFISIAVKYLPSVSAYFPCTNENSRFQPTAEMRACDYTHNIAHD